MQPVGDNTARLIRDIPSGREASRGDEALRRVNTESSLKHLGVVLESVLADDQMVRMAPR